MNSQSQLAKAISMAFDAHSYQTRNDGSPYIFHPLRVMMNVDFNQWGFDGQIVAVLHDVVEDSSDYTFDDILYHFGFDVDRAIRLLTKDDSMNAKTNPWYYEQYIEDIKKNPLATMVKILDISDNLATIDYIFSIDKRDRLRVKYEQALLELISK